MEKNKPIAVLITDKHLTKDTIDEVESSVLQTISVCKELGVSVVFDLGDHFTSRQSQELETILKFKEFVGLFGRNGIYYVTIPGNHDKVDQTIDDSWVDVVENVEGEFHNFKSGGTILLGDVLFHLLPYYKEDVYMEKLCELELDKRLKNVLLTHCGLDGVLNNDNISKESRLKKDLFKQFDKVFIGHYHNRTNVGKDILYIGSTDQRSFGEDEFKGCTVLYDDLTSKQIQFEFKKYKKVVVKDLSCLEKLAKQYKNSEDNIRFEIHGSATEISKINKKELNSIGIDVEFVDTELLIINDADESKRTISMDKKGILEGFIEYCELKGIERNKYVKVIKRF